VTYILKIGAFLLVGGVAAFLANGIGGWGPCGPATIWGGLMMGGVAAFLLGVGMSIVALIGLVWRKLNYPVA
jgi:hypothetical protein